MPVHASDHAPAQVLTPWSPGTKFGLPPWRSCQAGAWKEEPVSPTPEREQLDALLEHLKRQRGVDFASYKETTLRRRLKKRMQTVGAGSYD